MAELEVADAVVEYEVAGEGPAVTLLHGFTQSGRSWREVISLMPPRWRFITPDLRGHGRTRTRAGAAHDMEASRRDVLAIWDQLGVERSHLVGYSMGGRLALHIAAHSPERLLSLVTIGAHAGLDDGGRRERLAADEELARRIESAGIAAFVEYWTSLPLFRGLERRSPAVQAAIRAERMHNRPEALAASLRGMGAAAMEPLWERLASLGVPCLFIAGAEDHGYAAQARRLRDTIPGSRKEIVPRAGHAVHQERPQAFVNVLVDHLSTL